MPDATDLLSRSREPVYLQLATIFRRQIESGLSNAIAGGGICNIHATTCVVSETLTAVGQRFDRELERFWRAAASRGSLHSHEKTA